MLSKRSCEPCRVSKSKCDRDAAGCARCKRTGSQCLYAAPDNSIRIRNQTNAAERHAIRAWRARAKGSLTPTSQAVVRSRSSTPLEHPLTTDVETLAQNRFIYDFSSINLGLTLCQAFSIDQLSPSLTETPTKHEQRPEPDAAKAAFIATSLANFHRRHHDSRAASLEASSLGRALSMLATSLHSSPTKATHKTVLMAVLLGLHQNISPDSHLIGSWVHHFRGSVLLLDAASEQDSEETIYADLMKLVEKQALCFSLRAELPFPVTAAMRRNLDSRPDLRSRATAMGASVADFCARNGEITRDLEIHNGSAVFEGWKSLESKFDHLESDLHSALPFHKSLVDADTYPRWYHDIAVKPAGPINVYSYQCEDAVTIWNTTRMARMTLLSATLSSKLLGRTAFATTFHGGKCEHLNEAVLAAHIVELSEDLCASIFYYVSCKQEGAGEISSFEDVAGAKAYALISPLAVAAECLRRLPDRTRPAGRVEWIAHVLQVVRDRLGISESWCWRDGDEVAAWIEIERTLRFDRHSHQTDKSQS